MSRRSTSRSTPSSPIPLQPRRVFQDDRLAELAQSIRANGIIQPLVVRYVDGHYQLVAGERRWRAAKLAGVATVPVVVREIPEDRLLEITLIENIQREDLNPMETASAFARMSAELNLNAETIGLRTGKDRTTVINLMRLLQLPAGHPAAHLRRQTYRRSRALPAQPAQRRLAAGSCRARHRGLAGRSARSNRPAPR